MIVCASENHRPCLAIGFHRFTGWRQRRNKALVMRISTSIESTNHAKYGYPDDASYISRRFDGFSQVFQYEDDDNGEHPRDRRADQYVAYHTVARQTLNARILHDFQTVDACLQPGNRLRKLRDSERRIVDL